MWLNGDNLPTLHVDLNIPGGTWVHPPLFVTTILTGYVESNSCEAELYIKISGVHNLNYNNVIIINIDKFTSYVL